MTTVTTTDCPFPPQGHQIAVVIPVVVGGEVTNPGTLVSVVVPATDNIATPFPGASINTGSAWMKAVFYDTATGNTSGSPLASVDTKLGFAPVVLNLSFTKGLFVVQQSPSSIAVTTA
jgi:hypothetical protein